MTKRNQKLTLSRETVRRLDAVLRDEELVRVHGGDVSTDNPKGCKGGLSGESF